MIKIIALVKSAPGLSREDFLHRWSVEHPRVVWPLPGLRRYVQNPAIEGSKQWPYDGAAELWFDSVRDVAIAFDSAAADVMREHEETFLGDVTWFLADEREVPRPLGEPTAAGSPA